MEARLHHGPPEEPAAQERDSMLGISGPRPLLAAVLLTATTAIAACGSAATSSTSAGDQATVAPAAIAPQTTAAATATISTTSTTEVAPAPTAAPTSAPHPSMVATARPTAAPTPRPAPPPTARPTMAPTPAPAPASVVMTGLAGGQTVLVASSNHLTLYTYNADVAGSGTSNCNSGCISEWPPLTVPAGTMPTAGPGVTGHLGTIHRSDGSTQVTYNGKPLYFFGGDSAPGQTNGHYTGWSVATP